MIIKLIFGRGFIMCGSIMAIDCPNEHGGIGYATVKGELWTGETWINAPHLSFHWGNVQKIVTRSNDYESDEQWVTVWEAPIKFSYAEWIKAAQICREIK